VKAAGPAAPFPAGTAGSTASEGMRREADRLEGMGFFSAARGIPSSPTLTTTVSTVGRLAA
jgi:hypothetical protein